MFPQEILGFVEAVSVLGGFPHFFDVLGVDGAAFIAPVVADEGENSGGFGVVQDGVEGGHGGHPFVRVVGFVIDCDLSPEAVEGQFNEALGVTGGPLAGVDGRVDLTQAVAVILMAGSTVGFAVVDLGTEFEEFDFFIFEVSGNFDLRGSMEILLDDGGLDLACRVAFFPVELDGPGSLDGMRLGRVQEMVQEFLITDVVLLVEP